MSCLRARCEAQPIAHQGALPHGGPPAHLVHHQFAEEAASQLLPALCDVLDWPVAEWWVQEARQFQPEVLLLDPGMPGVSGYEACRQIRQEPWGRHAVIVALTGWGQEEIAGAARSPASITTS